MDDNKKNTEHEAQEYLNSILSDLYPKKDIQQKDRYSISFLVDKNGVVDLEIMWPEDTDEDMSTNIATLMFTINSGSMKELMIQAIRESIVIEQDLANFILGVVEKWAKFEDGNGAKPYINPRETLR